MIIDTRTMFCDNEAVSGSTGTKLEGNQIDLVNARDIGNGQPIYLIVVVTQAFASGGSATVNIQLASGATAAIPTNGTATVHWQTGALAYTALTEGKTFVTALPLEGNAYERYLGILVVTGTTSTTAGAISAFLSPDPVGWKAYPDAVS